MQTSPGMKHGQNKQQDREEIQKKFDFPIATKLEISMQNQRQWKTFTSNQKSLAINQES